MIVSMCWKQLRRFLTLVNCVITQLSNIEVTNNLVNTYTNGLKLLFVSLINEGQFWWGSWKINLKSIYCGTLPICEHASKFVITRYTFYFSIFYDKGPKPLGQKTYKSKPYMKTPYMVIGRNRGAFFFQEITSVQTTFANAERSKPSHMWKA